jgi:hypothetical protein
MRLFIILLHLISTISRTCSKWSTIRKFRIIKKNNMAQFVNEQGKLHTEIFTISLDYHKLSIEDKKEVLRLIKDWLDIEVIKILFEDE